MTDCSLTTCRVKSATWPSLTQSVSGSLTYSLAMKRRVTSMTSSCQTYFCVSTQMGRSSTRYVSHLSCPVRWTWSTTHWINRLAQLLWLAVSIASRPRPGPRHWSPPSSADGYTTEDLVFIWKKGDPVQVTKNLHLPRFTLEKFQTTYCTSRTNTGKFKS